MKDHYLITGGAGFIGTHLAEHYLAHNKHVTIFDNVSRHGAEENVRWLQQRYGKQLTLVKGDVRRPGKRLQELIEDTEAVFHLAAQVAVTTSMTNPREDFEVNALGTFNVLEAVRLSAAKPIVVYSSTNKVYGKLAELPLTELETRYNFADLAEGIPETHTLDFYSPYGCSKGIGDQYVRDYARIYGLQTIVFRQSCIYGPRQFGMEDQGWVAWFAIRAMQNLPITIYGDGKQVRDVLYIDDLIAAYDAAVASIAQTAGQAYNIGGGPQNTLSLIELLALLEQEFGHHVKRAFGAWRLGDQRIFVSDIRKAQADFKWAPGVPPADGVVKLVAWLQEHEHLFATA